VAFARPDPPQDFEMMRWQLILVEKLSSVSPNDVGEFNSVKSLVPICRCRFIESHAAHDRRLSAPPWLAVRSGIRCNSIGLVSVPK
jgi:hypothetical protein